MPERETYVYGPLASRRLGSSLGLDLVPRKTCDYDCIYCQLGRTTSKTTERKDYVPAGIILEQLRVRLDEVPEPDYVTISGSGEPTLNSELGAVIAGIRGITDTPIAVITNSSLLGEPEVAEACMQADLIVPSLDAADEETFRRINRPCRELELEMVVDGIASFSADYGGSIWLEVFIVDGVNSSLEHAGRMGDLVERIGPDRVQLNTAVRPTAESYARPVDADRLEELASILGMGAEAIEPLPHLRVIESSKVFPEQVLQLVRRRPCSIDDISKALGVNLIEASKMLAGMERKGLLATESRAGKIYYLVP